MTTPADIIAQVSQVTGIPAEIFTGETRTKAACYGRFLAVAAMRQRLAWISYADIALAVGRNDPGQAIHAMKRCRELIQTDRLFRQYAESLSLQLQ